MLKRKMIQIYSEIRYTRRNGPKENRNGGNQT